MAIAGSTRSEEAASAQRSVVLAARDLGHVYGRREVLGHIDFDVSSGEFVCIVGPSGVGKTTLLRCLSGLQQSTRGEIEILGVIAREPQAGVAVVFQDYSRSLMPWSSVLHNVTLPLTANGISRKDAERRARSALAQVGLKETVADQYPWQLSGGMQQRVAIARALAFEPQVLLMDEPFASVDAQTRADLEDLMRRLQQELQLTVLLVTHDIDEAVYLSDRVVALSGSPATVAEIVEIQLGSERDQIMSKNMAEFAEARARVHSLIRNASS